MRFVAKAQGMNEFMRINDRLRPFLPTVGAFRRHSMQVKWLSCKGLYLLVPSYEPPGYGTLGPLVRRDGGSNPASWPMAENYLWPACIL